MSIVTDTTGLAAGPLAIGEGPASVRSYYARPATVPAAGVPVVLVMHQIYGINDYSRDLCRRLAKAGCLAILPDLYRRYGSPEGLTREQITDGLASSVADAAVLEDIGSCLAWAASQGADRERAGVIGFAWGAQFVWVACAETDAFRAGVSWYGRLVRDPSPMRVRPWQDIARGLRAPVLGLYAGTDRNVPPEALGPMREALAGATVETEIVLYPEAQHGFHADYQPQYRADDAQDGWRRQMQWLARHGIR